MASQEKLLKSLEILKKLSSMDNNSESRNVKKEKIQNCHIITECLSNNLIQIAPSFPMLLNYTMETLFELCDDPDSDIRMVAEECLNKIIRALNDENIKKVLIELHKEIKRSKSARSLRAALDRFSKLAHYIRPHKGKPYVLNLFPSLIKIIDRPEESVHETLSNALPKIIEVLGPFATDNDIKNLLKSFMANISNPSPVIKRTTANLILNICLNCRKPLLSIVYCLHIVLGFMFPLNENCDSHLILGAMGVLKILLPHWRKFLKEKNNRQDEERLLTEWGDLKTDKLQQIYELCLYYIKNKDHNIVIYSLETLNTLLQNSTRDLKKALINPLGISKSKTQISMSSKVKSSNQLSMSGLLTPEHLNSTEADLTDSLRPDIKKWIDESTLSVLDSPLARKWPEKSQSEEIRSSTITKSFSEIDLGSSSHMPSETDHENITIRNNLEIATNSPEKSLSCEDLPDIPEKDVFIGEFNDHDVPLKYCARLIAKSFLLTGVPGHLISDKSCRISVKSSALLCLTTILRLYPKILNEYLDKSITTPQPQIDQSISDILLFSNHDDPQLRGNTRVLIANYIISVIIENGQQFDRWTRMTSSQKEIYKSEFERFKNIFISGLQDESSLCTRHTLQSLELCLKYILESEHSKSAIPILSALPDMASNPYWLVKVSLCDLICSLSYITIHHVTGDNKFQDKVLNDIIYELLKDSDVRVRNATSNALVKLIPQLYFEEHFLNNPVTSKAIIYREILLSDLYNKSWLNPTDDKNTAASPFPFNKMYNRLSETTELALSKIVVDIQKMIWLSNCKNTTLGCLETLASLSMVFPCTVFKKSWRCFTPKENSLNNQTNDLLKLCVSLMNNSELVYEIGCHTNLLKLSSNLYAGYSLFILKPTPEEESTKRWEMFKSTVHANLSEKFLKHLVKVLSIYQHIVDDVLPLPLHPKPIILSLPTASPIKRRKSDLEKKFISPSKIMEEKSDKKEKDKNSLGSFSHIPHYVKIYDALKTAYGNYKTSLESTASEKFLHLLKETLNSLSILMEIGSLLEFGQIAEEILTYLNSIFKIEPSATIQCVQQLLKSIFGTNLLAIGVNKSTRNDKKDHMNSADGDGFYKEIFLKPYQEVSQCINSLNYINNIESDGDSTIMGYRHRNTKRKPILTRNLDKVLANYIRIFEPMVIKSLKQYTITSDVKLQGQVLHLLSQLVQLKINYCLLDADQIFINFVINQFEYIEEGQIQHSEELVPKIFQFLVQLSYSKQHSKSIISVPKIIQLCDGLLASGQCPLTHCIPALKPIVEDIFLTRNALNTPDDAELETTREVVLAMLLKLIEHHEIIELLILILDDSKYCSDPDKWLRWSQSVANSFISILKTNKYKLDCTESFNSLKKLIFSLNPNVFRPIDDIVIMLFQDPPSLDQDIFSFTRWLGKIISILIILSPVKEDVILTKITSLKNNFVPNSVFENIVVTPDPLNVTNSADFFQHLSSEIILIRFIFRTLTLATKKCTLIIENEESPFFIQELSTFMMFCIHNFQSGFLCRTANVAISIIEKSKYAEECDAICVDPINENFRNLLFFYPTLTFEWCYFLTLLGYEDRNFWTSILQLPSTESDSFESSNSINIQIVKVGGSIVLCDYLCDKPAKENAEIYWLIQNNVNLLVDLDQEAPVNEFFTYIHRDPKLSHNLLVTIAEHSLNYGDVLFRLKLLKRIENAHINHTGQLINILLMKMDIKELLLTKPISKLATRKLEQLLTMSTDNVHTQLTKEELLDIIKLLNRKELNTKHEALLALLYKVATKFYNLDLQEKNKNVDTSSIKKQHIDKEWYLRYVKSKLNKARIGKEIAEILCILNYEELFEIMQDEHFNKLILKYCIDYGVHIFKTNSSNQVPDILTAAVDSLYKEIEEFLKSIQNYNNMESNLDLKNYFQSENYSDIFNSIIPCVLSYLESIPLVPQLEMGQDRLENILMFAILSLEFLNYLVLSEKPLNINITNHILKCFNMVLKHNSLFHVLSSDIFLHWSSSAVHNIYYITEYLLNKTSSKKASIYTTKNLYKRLETASISSSCIELYILFNWIHKRENSKLNIPASLLKDLDSIIVSLGRLSIFNSFMLIPNRAWDRSIDPHNPILPLPVEILQEVDILEDYIFRTILLGWNSRQQFEETWMCLLGVLCNAPSEEMSAEETNEIHTSVALAVKAITAILMQTLYYPVPGKSNISKWMHVPRNAQIACDKISVNKLKEILLSIRDKYNSCCYFSEQNMIIDSLFDEINLEKEPGTYSCGQMSVKYLLIAVGILEDADKNSLAYKIWNSRDEMLQKYELDVTSCLHSLQDFYTQLLEFQKINSLTLLHEIVTSILVLSDLFNDKSQFSWMLDLFLGLLKVHAVEDELLHHYLIIGVCKATAVLNPELEVYEIVKKYLIQFLKSTFLPSKLACMNGLLYILEGCKLNNISIGGISEELQIILPCAVDHIQANISILDKYPHGNQDYILLMWALAFYILENIEEVHIESTFQNNILTSAITILSNPKGNKRIYKCLMKGLQRLILKKSILEKIEKKVLKLSLDGLKNENPFIAIESLQLLFTHMYTECADHVESQDGQTSPETLVQTIEKFSAIFEHIKKGFIFEVEIVCSLLPQVLDDFFTPADILTKVICEFLSTQQPHQKLLSRVIFSLFQNAIRQNQLSLLQDWVVFSLPNFTQNFSYSMATWCLTCFFISASCNKWLISLFPYVQTRMQRYEYEDRELLCISGSDFYRNLSSEKQKQTFQENFKIVRDLPEMPFNDLLSSL